VYRISISSTQNSLDFLLNIYFCYKEIYIRNNIENVEISLEFKIEFIVNKKNLIIHEHLRRSHYSSNDLSVFDRLTTTTSIVYNVSLSCYDSKNNR